MKTKSACIVAICILICLWLAMRICGGMIFWNARGYDYGILAEDVFFYEGCGTNSVCRGFLKKGAIVFAPDKNDYYVTDPGDIQFHKVYVRLSHETLHKMIIFPSPSEGTNAMPEKAGRRILEE